MFQEKEAHCLIPYDGPQHGTGAAEGSCTDVLQADRDDRIFSHVCITQALFFLYGETVKKAGVAAVFKEIFEHVHIEGFTETPWAGKKIYLAPVV